MAEGPFPMLYDSTNLHSKFKFADKEGEVERKIVRENVMQAEKGWLN